jgi:hypothetical protein
MPAYLVFGFLNSFGQVDEYHEGKEAEVPGGQQISTCILAVFSMSAAPKLRRSILIVKLYRTFCTSSQSRTDKPRSDSVWERLYEM